MTIVREHKDETVNISSNKSDKQFFSYYKKEARLFGSCENPVYNIFLFLSIKIIICKYLTKPEIFRWGRMASFQEKSLKRSSFQSLLSVLGHYITLNTRQ